MNTLPGTSRVLVGLCLTLSFAIPVQGRAVLSLDGEWNFATDPAACGETEGWYLPATPLPAMPLPGYAPTANGKIIVPGIWDHQGYGTETEKVRHNFVGKGWYKRTVAIPDTWAGQRVFLLITGISRYSKVWINEHYLGEHIGFLSIQEHEISQHAPPGQSVTLTIQVDSKQRWDFDTMYGASSLADFMDVAWGGIWGHVLLETRTDAWLSDLFVQPDVPGGSCVASATLSGKAELCDNLKLEVFDQGGQRVADAALSLDTAQVPGTPVSIKAALPSAHLWSPETPTLYTAKLSLLKGAQTLDVIESRFGMRQFTTSGYSMLLNGKKIMLCGYGDDHIYPEQMAMPSDKELHLKRLRLIKSYGFNHVRHHSTVMAPEYYEACDEVGIITTVEFPIVYAGYMPQAVASWKTDIPKDMDPQPALDTYHREWTATIKRYRNHPCVLCWVMGNELFDDVPLGLDFQRTARELDPSRFFSESNGLFANDTGHWLNILDPKNDRDTQDIYFALFHEYVKEPFNDTAKYDSPQPKKPAVAHEMGNYITFSRPDLAEQFQHNMKPFWLTAGVDKLKRLGLFDEAEQWALKSERLYALLHKYNLEMLRKNPYLSGYHWWLFQDYWTSANGIVDHYFRPKSITSEEVLKYNNEVVLLQDGLERTYRGKDRLRLKLSVSNFASEPLHGDFVWEVNSGKKTIVRQRVPVALIPQGEISELTTIDLVLPEPDAPSHVKIIVSLSIGKKQFNNDWSTWLYPAVIVPSASPVPVYADEVLRKQCPEWGWKPIPVGATLDPHALYAVTFFDPRVADALEQGAKVLLIKGAELFLKTYLVTYKTSWWKAGDKPEENNTGTFVYDHPITRAIAPDGWCDEGWSHLIEGGEKYDLEDAPCRPEVIVRALSSMAMVQDEALLFAVGVGQGTLIVSGLNHMQTADRPENEWLLARMLDYAATRPQPKAVWPATFIMPVCAAPEGCLPGFRRVLADQDNAMPEKTSWHSYCAEAASVFICRQDKKGNALAWETVAYQPKEPPDERVTFVFAGALGFSAQPQTEGFVLEVNDQEALQFDMPAAENWKSADGRVELRFEARKAVSVDTFGLFYVTIARELLTPGQPCRLCVRSLGEGSRRWFGLNPYTDVQ